MKTEENVVNNRFFLNFQRNKENLLKINWSAMTFLQMFEFSKHAIFLKLNENIFDISRSINNTKKFSNK